MIRIVTRFGDKRVTTLQYNGKWITLTSLSQYPHLSADDLYQAGRNHLQAACALKDSLQVNASE